MILSELIKPRDDGTHKREIGKYWASEIGQIMKGYLKPQDYLKEKVIDECGATNIFFGVALENLLTQRMAERGVKMKPQERVEMEINDFKLVVKPDYVGEIVIEAKCPVLPLETIPERYKCQLEAEYRAFLRPTYLLSFQRPRFELFRFEPSDERWEEIKNKLSKFNNLVKQYGNK